MTGRAWPAGAVPGVCLPCLVLCGVRDAGCTVHVRTGSEEEARSGWRCGAGWLSLSLALATLEPGAAGMAVVACVVQRSHQDGELGSLSLEPVAQLHHLACLGTAPLSLGLMRHG